MNARSVEDLLYPCCTEVMGAQWVSVWKGRFTDVEMQRNEDHFREQIKARRHEADCEAACMAALAERGAA